MKYKNTAKNILAILLAAAMLFCLDHIFAPKYLDENLDGRITREFYGEKAPLNVIALGSSTMYNAVIPDQLYGEQGITSYVRSNASQTLWQSYYLLKDALFVGKKPDLVMVDVSFIKYGEEFVEEPSNRKALESMRDPISKYRAVKASMYSEEEPVSYYLPVFRYHSRWKELTGQDVKNAVSAPKVTYHGYLMEYDIPDTQDIYEPEELEEGYEFPQKATEYLDKIIALCEKEQIPLLLMKTPTYVNSWHPEYDEMLSKLAAERGIAYQNFDEFKDEMELNVRTDYIDDGSHMNFVGASKFTNKLGNYLKENYSFRDLTKDEKCKSLWEAAGIRFEKDRTNALTLYEKRKQELGL